MIPLNSRQVGQTVERYGNSGTPSMNADTERHKEDGSESQTDLQLVRKVRHGDRPAFDLLVVKYQSRVASIISRYVYDSQEVMDLTQETFVKAYRAIDRFRGDSAFYTWLYRIGINTAKNHLVSMGRRPSGRDIKPAGGAPICVFAQGVRRAELRRHRRYSRVPHRHGKVTNIQGTGCSGSPPGPFVK